MTRWHPDELRDLIIVWGLAIGLPLILLALAVYFLFIR
jgi:hypothetical protein